MALIGVTGPGVLDTSTTTGTGTYTLAGAILGYQSVGNVLADGDTAYFASYGVDGNGNRNGDGWEEFYGTYTASGTLLARTTVLKSSNANAAVNWPAGTRRIVLIDVPSKSKGLNALTLNSCLPNAKLVRIQGVNLSTGDNDLYTAPAGKRAYLQSNVGTYNNSAGNISQYTELKISGTYYRLSTTNTQATGTFSSSSTGIVLEPGETLSINVATTNGLNVHGSAIEFDSTTPFFSPKLLNSTSGDKTLYTCPTGKTALILATTLPAIFGTNGSFSNVGGAVSTTTKIYIVPSGQAVGNNYLVIPNLASGVNSRNVQTLTAALSAGDFINVNVDANTPPLIFTNILEIGN